jgi:hypothetical protein
VYAKRDNSLYVNLFVESTAKIELANQAVRLHQETRYPWKGEVKITVDPEREEEFVVFIRIPGWAQDQPVPSDLYRFLDEQGENIVIRVNGNSVPFETEKGFVRLHRKWSPGDTIELSLPMPVRRVSSHENVEDNQGMVALQRGPIVFCFEGVDNADRVLDRSLADDSPLETEFLPDLLKGVVIVRGVSADKSPFRAIPYFAWAHRRAGEMAVWIHRE